MNAPTLRGSVPAHPPGIVLAAGALLAAARPTGCFLHIAQVAVVHIIILHVARVAVVQPRTAKCFLLQRSLVGRLPLPRNRIDPSPTAHVRAQVPKQLCVACDESPQARSALHWALDNLVRPGDRLHLATVAAPIPFPVGDDGAHPKAAGARRHGPVARLPRPPSKAPDCRS